MTLWFVEGLPGTGKTTMAEQLCAIAQKSGRAAAWYLEESIDHPVHGQSLKLERKNGGGFVTACLDSWHRFAERAANDAVIHILEGSAFQSTVRFMMEEELSGIEEYYTRFEEIVSPLAARVIYLRPKDAIQHSLLTSLLRGEVWTGKVSNYLEKTAYSKSRGLVGTSGMHRFWADYAVLCDRIIRRSALPVKTINVEPGEWERHSAEAVDFFGFGPGK
jgi:hypothetical protein